MNRGAKNFDLLIIGGGAAGLTAGIYAARAGLQTLLLEKWLIGGLAATTDLIENYPGFPEGINGAALMEKMKMQAQRFGTEIVRSEVKTLSKIEKNIMVETDKERYIAKAAIIATGGVPKKLNIPGEDTLRGRGVSYCATCDGPLFRDKDIAVIGCGNSGVQEGLFLLKFAKNITFVEFLPQMTADKILQERLKKETKAKVMVNHEIMRINGEKRVEAVVIRDRASKKDTNIPVDGVFIYVGVIPFSHFLKGVVNLDDDGFIVTDEKLVTSVPGMYAAGDVRSKKIRQIITACAEGAEAAIHAYHYIDLCKR